MAFAGICTLPGLLSVQAMGRKTALSIFVARPDIAHVVEKPTDANKFVAANNEVIVD